MKTEAERFNYARKQRGLSLKQLGEDFGVTGNAITRAIQRDAIKPLYLRIFSDKYLISHKWLVTGEGNFDNVGGAQITQEPEQQYFPENVLNYSNDKINPLGSPQVIQVPLVHKYAYAGYLSGFNDDEYMENLPKHTFQVDHTPHGKYLAFEIKGDSMDDGTNNGYRSGEIALCREVQKQHWRDKLHINKWDFIIAHKTDGILFKRITKQNNGFITCHSLNNLYEDFDINLNDVSQLLNVIQTVHPRRR